MTQSEPNPTPLSEEESELLSVDDLLKAKRHDCDKYLQCLGRAAKENWAQFSCLNCSVYKHSPPTPVEIRLLSSMGKALAEYADSDDDSND